MMVSYGLIKSSGWTSGGPTVYKLWSVPGNLSGMSLVVIFHIVWGECSGREQLSSSLARELVNHLVVFRGRNLERPGLQRESCVSSMNWR